MESYSTSFQNLLIDLKPPTYLNFFRVATCALLLDLSSRLGMLTKVKKEGTFIAGKLVQPILQLLCQDDSEDVSSDITNLFCVILRFFPSSLQQTI